MSYEGSSALELASIEPEPSALICGCVHAVTGDFLFQQPDMVVKGAQTIVIPRKYFSSAHEASIEDQILPHRRAFGWGISDYIHITRLSISEPNGMVFTYLQSQNRVYQPAGGLFQTGITGYCTDYLGNRYHPANNHAYWSNDTTLLVQTSTGELRVYEKARFVSTKPECQFEFRLCRIRLSNGMLIDYQYKKDNLKGITALSAAKKKGEVFSKVEFSEKDNQLLIKGSDESKLEYEYRDYKRKLGGKKRRVKLLKYVVGSLYPRERLKREEKSMRIKERHFDHERSLACEYDKAGRVTKLQGPQGILAMITYEKGVTTSIDRGGNKTVYVYDPKTLRIDEIHYFQSLDHLLKTETYTWTLFGCLEQKTISSGDGEVFLEIHCKYNEHLDLSHKTISKDHETHTYTYDYNEQHLLKEEREDNGKRVTYTYLKGTTLPEEICTYNEAQLLKRTRYRYDEDCLLTSETIDDGTTYFRKEIQRKKKPPFYGMPEIISEYSGDHLIKKTKFTYDSFGNVTKTDCYGSDGKLATTTHTIYNEKDQIIKEIDPEGNATEFRYDDNGNLTWKKTPLGLEIHYTYDSVNRLIEERQTGCGQTLITRYQDFDPLDHYTKVIDPLGGVTYRKYDALGNLIEETNPKGYTTHYTHDALGNEISVTDPLGNTTRTTYNHYNSPLCHTHPDGSVETYTYNPDGTKASYTNEFGITTLYTYDAFNNLASEEILGEAKKTWIYDAFHLLQEINLDGYTTNYEYDELSRKSKETYAGQATHFTYDPLSRVTSEQTKALRTEWSYNKQGHITSEKTYDQGHLIYQTQTTYNAEGSPLEVTTYPNNELAIAKTTYDAFGRQTSHTTPLGNKTTTTYQIESGKKTITTHEMGGITQIQTFNALDQLLTQERKDASGAALRRTEYTYDSCGNPIKQTTNTHTTEWTYDNRHRKITETESGQKTTHSTYYPDGKLQTLTKPDGTKLSYTYNNLGHLISLHSSKGDIHYTYAYNNQGHLLLAKDLIHQTQTKRIVDPHGNILEEELANNIRLKNRYDELGRRVDLILPDKTITYTHAGTNLATVTIDDKSHDYTYDQSNNLIQERHIDGSTTYYTYDLDSRLIHRKHPHLEETLQYDQRGNLVKITRNGEEFCYCYDSFDHLIEEPQHTYRYDPLHNRIQKDKEATTYNSLNQETELKFDPNGNLLCKGSYSLEYDSLGRLIKAKTWFTTTTYTYDPEHRRILENSTPILWDGQHEMGELNSYRILGRTPFAEIGSSVAIHNQGKLLQPLHTATGDVFQILEQSSPQNFTAFGEGEANIRWGYRSKVHDQSGLIYFGRRYYDPDTSRFITPDPEGYLDSPNLYAYTLNNPLTHHDPYGLFAYPPNLQFIPRYTEKPEFDPSRWKEVGSALYHASLSYARDTTLSAGKYLGGYHGPEDMSFTDIYSAHTQANEHLIKRTDNWMATSPYAGSDLYHLTRGIVYTGIDFSTGFLFPFAGMKTAASAGKAILKAEKIAHVSPTLLKTNLVTGKVFKSSKNSSLKAGNFKYSNTAAKHFTEVIRRGPNAGRLSRPYMKSPLTINEIMAAKQPITDPGGLAGGLRWDVPGTFRGNEGTWELVLHPESQIIYHFNFK